MLATVPRWYGGDPVKRSLLNPTCGSLKRDLAERIYIPKDPPNPNSYMLGLWSPL